MLDSDIGKGIESYILKQRLAAENAKAQQQRDRAKNLRPVDAERDHIYGNPDAPITLIEYSDFECPFCKRFHVMHRAGEAGDWAVAGHELSEMKRMAAMSSHIDAEKSTLMPGMLEPGFEALSKAIEHGDNESFVTALDGTISACNACHVASESSFIQVTLDARDAISPRHPHAFTGSELAQGHSHGGQAMMQENMQGMMKENPAQEGRHDESGEDGHHD